MGQVVRHRSSYIDETVYDQVEETLDVTFSSGAQWRYRGVPHDVYIQFATAPSRGKAFHALIRDSYEAEQL